MSEEKKWYQSDLARNSVETVKRLSDLVDAGVGLVGIVLGSPALIALAAGTFALTTAAKKSWDSYAKK
ncbi:MAG: hypothetical protein N2691_02365 [Patescibacteria group bacterium]|nr:hypothetical protein [Patescibacteria group bacterium]